MTLVLPGFSRISHFPYIAALSSQLFVAIVHFCKKEFRYKFNFKLFCSVKY